MQRYEARRLAENTSDADLITMLQRARSEVEDWREPAHINPSLSRGAMFNIFVGCNLNGKGSVPVLAKTNMIAEFGEYLPGYEKPKRRRRAAVALLHQDPKPYPAN